MPTRTTGGGTTTPGEGVAAGPGVVETDGDFAAPPWGGGTWTVRQLAAANQATTAAATQVVAEVLRAL
jgi:hypothetical protein